MARETLDSTDVDSYAASRRDVLDPRSTIIRAAELLIASGFAIDSHRAGAVELSGPGLRSTKQNPILGASHIHLFERGSSTVELQATLGGVRWMRRFVFLLPASFAVLGVAVALTVAMLDPDDGRHTAAWIALASLGSASPWLILSPLIARSIRLRTHLALDHLLESAVALARRDTSP